MASLQATSKSAVVEPSSGPHVSFSSDFLDESEFISICPNPEKERQEDEQRAKANFKATEFEFLSGNLTNMLPADELFCEGKLLPFWQAHQDNKLNRIALKSENHAGDDGPHGIKQLMPDKEENRISWFVDDDPSPRPPKCTVLLWKELLRLKKQRGSSMTSLPGLSPASSSSSKASLSAMSGTGRKERSNNNNNNMRVSKRGGERTRSGSIRIRPVINVPICSQAKNTALFPVFSSRKVRLEK